MTRNSVKLYGLLPFYGSCYSASFIIIASFTNPGTEPWTGHVIGWAYTNLWMFLVGVAGLILFMLISELAEPVLLDKIIR